MTSLHRATDGRPRRTPDVHAKPWAHSPHAADVASSPARNASSTTWHAPPDDAAATDAPADDRKSPAPDGLYQRLPAHGSAAAARDDAPATPSRDASGSAADAVARPDDVAYQRRADTAIQDGHADTGTVRFVCAGRLPGLWEQGADRDGLHRWWYYAVSFEW